MNWLNEMLQNDPDPQESREWIESLKAVIDHDGAGRAHQLLEGMVELTRRAGAYLPFDPTTSYINTIPTHMEPAMPGDATMEWRIRSMIRWNAMAMVVRANRKPGELGGHIASFASSATLYDVGFNHFWRAPSADHPGDLLYIQGHSSPGIYARAFLEGRISESQLDNFRMEVDGRGISSYPHPWLMPDFWQTPTVSMGLGPIAAIYQARSWKYLEGRGLMPKTDRKVWCFLGDGETDEPETLGAIALAGRERLDNLTWVVNCNLQRLDGPVRGNGKIIQELEGVFRGAGWDVIKVVWGHDWDPLLEADRDGALVDKMNATVDGEFQRYAVEPGSYAREHFFGPDPRLRQLVEHLSDDDISQLRRGGHDYRKLFAAYHRATHGSTGRPTVILAKTIKGWTLGEQVAGRNSTHQIKKMNAAQIRELRDRLQLGGLIPDEALDGHEPPFVRFAEGTPEHDYVQARRRALGGSLPKRQVTVRRAIDLPDPAVFDDLRTGSGTQPVSTTMAFVRLLRGLTRDAAIGRRIVPIVPDEARTFGMDSLFPEIGIYSSVGQKYEPVDHHLLLNYKESTDGAILEEGITEAGAMASWTAAATSYATRGVPMLPFFIFYSMFGFQRVGDLIWAAADARARGFILGATAGRTTLMGEGLQHQDGHSLLLASAVPVCRAYDPAFAYEVAAIIEHGTTAMLRDNIDEFYYLTLYNENYPMPPLDPDRSADVGRGVIDGLYRWQDRPDGDLLPATILFSGSTWQAAADARGILAERFGVGVDLWSATSYKALRDDAMQVERWNLLHPTETPRTPRVTSLLAAGAGPVVAVTDFVRAVPDQVARWVPRPYTSLGTDGFGRSDTREALRRFFEIDAAGLVVSVLGELVKNGTIKRKVLARAIADLGIATDDEPPWRR